ncbi:hypothetical protein BV20DRAFT_1057141 [Pilatotrama ljubarskyi]|nr:hypothetical protein BV20DRAFT_1057141 [Pilatotrama ljubarskyi]
MSDSNPPRIKLCIAEYIREGLPDCHWALVAAIPSNPRTRIFQIVGGTASYGYHTKEVPILASKTLCGGCEVGEVLGEASLTSDNVRWLETHLATAVTIVRNDPKWNCQTWVIEVLRELQEHADKVRIYPVDTAQIRAKLAEEREHWEFGDDIYYNKLIPTPQS